MRLFLVCFFMITFNLASASKTHEIPSTIIIDSPSILKAQSGQVERRPLILQYKIKGQVGESETGLLMIREPKSLKPEILKAITVVVDAENVSRKNELEEIAKINQMDAQTKAEFVKIYFSVNKGTDPKGTYFFESNTWQKKY